MRTRGVGPHRITESFISRRAVHGYVPAGSGRRAALIVAFPFLFMFGLVAILAQAQSVETSAPWFTPEINEAVYGVTLVVAILLTAGTGVWVAHRRAVLDDRIRAIDVRLAVIGSALTSGDVSVTQGARSGGAATRSPPSDEPVFAMGSGMTQRFDMPVTRLESNVSTEAASAGLRVEAQELTSLQAHWLRQRSAIWAWMAGPIGIGILYATIAGAMLPGSGGFLMTNFHLNTTLVLFLAYTWWLLLAWLVVALAAHSRDAPKPRPENPAD